MKLIEHIKEQEYSLEKIFGDLDVNGDKILSKQEIMEGLKKIEKLKLDEEEVEIIGELMDQDKDDNVTLEEFIGYIERPLRMQKVYWEGLHNLNINNPMSLEECILDLEVQQRYLEQHNRKLHEQYQKISKQCGQDQFEYNQAVLKKQKVIENYKQG